MAAKKIKSGSIASENYINYLHKAQEFYDTMQTARAHKNWNAVGLNAVHCAISANDALLVYKKGIRSTSESHYEAIELLRVHIEHPQIDNMTNHLRKIIAKKNLIEYEARDIRESEAEEIIKHTERFFTWVRSLLA